MAISRRDCSYRTSMSDLVTTSVQNGPPPGTAAATTPAAATTSSQDRQVGSMIAVRSLVKRIGQQDILRGVDLDVTRGETLAIIGRSGGGKSVLLKHLVGLMKPNAGQIWVEGQNIIALNERQLAMI